MPLSSSSLRIDAPEEEARAFWKPEPVFKMRYRVSLEDGWEIGVSRKMRTRVRLPLADEPP